METVSPEALKVADEVYISRYLAAYQNRTRGTYQRVLFDWLRFCIGADLHILEADRVVIEQWANALGRRLRPGSVATRLVPVCGFYRWAHQEGLLAVDVAAHVRRPHRPRRSNLRWLSRQQATDLLAASRQAGPPADVLVHLLLLNGLRLGETLAARIEHLEEVDDRTVLLLPDRKMGVMDRVSLPAETITLLPGCIRTRHRGRILDGLKAPRVYALLDALSDSTGLEFRARPHMLRATFVTLALDAGIPARDIIASAGWVSREMLEYYDRAHASIRRNASHSLATYLTE